MFGFWCKWEQENLLSKLTDLYVLRLVCVEPGFSLSSLKNSRLILIDKNYTNHCINVVRRKWNRLKTFTFNHFSCLNMTVQAYNFFRKSVRVMITNKFWTKTSYFVKGIEVGIIGKNRWRALSFYLGGLCSTTSWN